MRCPFVYAVVGRILNCPFPLRFAVWAWGVAKTPDRGEFSHDITWGYVVCLGKGKVSKRRAGGGLASVRKILSRLCKKGLQVSESCGR